MTVTTVSESFDVIIVGAGISGIGAAYHLQTECPNKSFVILEGRESLGGTWDLFRYPGIRSDSDMYTLGYSFRPWSKDKSIADGASILEYVRETAQAFGIDRKIRYRKRVERARWSSDDARWTIDVRDLATNEVEELTCKFFFACAGYYDYESGYTPAFEGRERFRGSIVHPQFWTSDIDYANKRVVVIGSGATAMTLVPALANEAAHVTMLQRSPTYVISMPAADPIAKALRRWLPERAAYDVTRWKNVVLSTAFYKYCKRFPDRAKKLLLSQVRRALRGSSNVDTHFTPTYKPWDQRLCLVPDGDLFKSIRAGKASVVTDRIARFTETGIALESGEHLEADIIVTATGLKMRLLGGITLEVDGKRVTSTETVLYKGVMLSEVPNLAIAIGYTNASWTLKCDLASEWVCRLLNHMDRENIAWACPRRRDLEDVVPVIDLASGYVTRALDHLPKQGTRPPWRLHQNYVLDRRLFRKGTLEDGVLELRPHRSSPSPSPSPSKTNGSERVAFGASSIGGAVGSLPRT